MLETAIVIVALIVVALLAALFFKRFARMSGRKLNQRRNHL